MKLRKYGKAPYKIIVVHGGPGAPGTVAPIARELKDYGVIEPFQTCYSINGQIEELKDIILSFDYPVTLIGHSWEAWLIYMLASKYPKLVKKLILISSGPFESKYLSQMKSYRNDRLNQIEQDRVGFLFNQLNDNNITDKKSILKEFGELMNKADSYSPIDLSNEAIDFNPDIFNNCINELNVIRNEGTLLKYGLKINCPVVVIHGVYDSHPFEGVVEPLKDIVSDFKYYLIDNCGHTPWNEVYAKDEFFNILTQQLK